jgi:hypothetical protein
MGWEIRVRIDTTKYLAECSDRQLQRVEAVQYGVRDPASPVGRIEHGDAIRAVATPSPSIVNDLARSFPAADAMAG